MESGVDSLAASEFVKLLAVEFGLELSATLLFDRPSMSTISSHISDELFSASSESHSTAGVAEPMSTTHSTAGVAELMSATHAVRARSKHDKAPVELAQAVEGVAVISYNRPEKGNSFDAAVSRGLVCMLGVLDRDAATSSVVVTGRGSYFCAAAKFDEMLGPAHPSELAS